MTTTIGAPRSAAGVLFLGWLALGACMPDRPVVAPCPAPEPPATALEGLVPLPALLEPRPSEAFVIGTNVAIVATDTSDTTRFAAAEIAKLVRRATGIDARMLGPRDPAPSTDAIVLGLDRESRARDDAYDLVVSTKGIALRATTPAGLFYGVTTLRQLMPPAVEHDAIVFTKPVPAKVPAVHVADAPRYAWRGAMLDVSRHFFGVDDVKRFVDMLALHKMNRLHLHLADDQGWRIEIKSWPELTKKGGLGQVALLPKEGAPVLAYTQEQYAEIVRYAAARFVTIVPEIDLPGHTNAALSTYAELNCDGVATKPFAGTETGFSAICVDKDVTYKFIDDVVREIAALTPGAYFHAGGDEVKKLGAEAYAKFIERVQKIIAAHGKRMIGWDEIAAAKLLPETIVQHWRPDASKELLAASPHLLVSPADRAYLDMKYDPTTIIGLDWAALVPVQRAYEWDPDATVPGARPGAVLGVEAPLWSETTVTMRDVEYLVMPRLAEIAEIGWTPQAKRTWSEFRVRLGMQAPRWTALGINFYRAPEVPWRRSPMNGSPP